MSGEAIRSALAIFALPGERSWYEAVSEAEAELAALLAALEALREVHEFHCGCDRPGDPSRCVATPREEFAALVPA